MIIDRVTLNTKKSQAETFSQLDRIAKYIIDRRRRRKTFKYDFKWYAEYLYKEKKVKITYYL